MNRAMIQSLEPDGCWYKIATYAADVAAALIDSPEYRTALVKCGFSPRRCAACGGGDDRMKTLLEILAALATLATPAETGTFAETINCYLSVSALNIPAE